MNALSMPVPAQASLRPAGGEAAKSELRQAAEGFEALFVRRMLEAARAAEFGGEDPFGSQGEDTFTEMRDAHFAELASKAGTLGIADMLEIQMQRQIGGS